MAAFYLLPCATCGKEIVVPAWTGATAGQIVVVYCADHAVAVPEPGTDVRTHGVIPYAPYTPSDDTGS